MIVRVGVEGRRRTLLERAARLKAPILVSANSLWNNRSKSFRKTRCYEGHDLALDSGGFVAMRKYGGFRWTVEQYVELAQYLKPTWWAAMDYCCEPEIAGTPSRVAARIDSTADYLHRCQDEAARTGTRFPMPVLQGWQPADYCSGPIYDWPEFAWPSLVGIGSVCRRKVHGPDGVVAVITALHAKVPPHVRFHLFGVKSQALHKLVEKFPSRIGSMDSMAWNVEARWQAFRSGLGRDKHRDADVMAEWYLKQTNEQT